MLGIGILSGSVLTACSAASELPASSGSASTQQADGGDVDGRDENEADEANDASAPVTEVDFASLMDDPEPFVGASVRMTGNVFFFPQCPPPGASDPKCTLLGYVADPEQRTFIAADAEAALPLAENGVRVACDESGAARPSCPGWTADATYTLEGVVERQVLGGRETDLVWLDVTDKGEPQHW